MNESSKKGLETRWQSIRQINHLAGRKIEGSDIVMAVYAEGRLVESMGINEFAQNVCRQVEQELGEDYNVEVREVKKNNGVVFHGLIVMHQASSVQNVIPTIYLDDLFKDYRSGTDFTTVTQTLLRVYRESVPRESIDMGFFRSFEKVRERICFRLVRREGNEWLLEDVPHKEFLDLAVCFYYAYHMEPLGEGAILIHNSHMEMWGTCVEELYALAQENTPSLFPWECSSLEEIMKELTGWNICGEAGDSDNSSFGEIPMRVLSNKKRIHGAACVLYPGVLEKLAASEQRNLFIFPSSVHEVILLEDTGQGREEEFKKMIAYINAAEVAPAEVLSDSLYYYDFKDKTVKIVGV